MMAVDLLSINNQHDLDYLRELARNKTRICASLGSRMKFKTLCYPVFGRNKKILISNYFDSFQCFHSMSN